MTKVLSLRNIFMVMLLFAFAINASAQKIHEVKKGETIFGIAKQYEMTIDQLRDANPMMKEPEFVLKKGLQLYIPQKKAATPQPTKVQPKSANTQAAATKDLRKHITVGVMLPLHDVNGDGKRMIEYYRGILLAANDLKSESHNITINAWNVAEDSDIRQTLLDPKAAECDVIFGPLYSAQVQTLANFCMAHDIRLVIPFSISGNNVQTCPMIYQVYQTPNDITAHSIDNFVSLFSDTHPIFVDCNDATSQKGSFTFGLRKILEEKKINYSITNINNSPEMWRKAFDNSRKNVVILNTGRSPELGLVFKHLDEMTAAEPHLKISMYGYNEWFLYTKIYQDKFSKYDAYIPSTYDYNAERPTIKRVEQLYKKYYNVPLMYALPSFALTGYDHMMFFMRGLHSKGNDFHGKAGEVTYTPIQTPLRFERLGNGGYQNRSFMLVKFK